MSLLVTGLSVIEDGALRDWPHRKAPVSLREQFAVAEDQLPEVMADLRGRAEVEEIVVLSTCHRVELYAAHDAPSVELAEMLKRSLAVNRNFCEGLGSRILRDRTCPRCGFAARRNFCGGLGAEVYTLMGRRGIRHLFRVASGLDSEIIGETEILGQMKRAYQIALQHRHTGKRLNKAFQKAFQAAKQCRSETKIQQGAKSVAAAAVELAEKSIFDGLRNHRVLVLGAGDTSKKTARALLSRGAGSVLVSNRSYDKAAHLARELGERARPVRFEEWGAEFSEIDIVISSTAAKEPILSRDHLVELLKNRPARPLLLIDIAVPRDIDEKAGFLDNVYLYNVDDLQKIVNEYRKRQQKEIARCEEIIGKRVDEFVDGLSPSLFPSKRKPALGSEG